MLPTWVSSSEFSEEITKIWRSTIHHVSALTGVPSLCLCVTIKIWDLLDVAPIDLPYTFQIIMFVSKIKNFNRTTN
jgi:hypothetical protein